MNYPILYCPLEYLISQLHTLNSLVYIVRVQIYIVTDSVKAKSNLGCRFIVMFHYFMCCNAIFFYYIYIYIIFCVLWYIIPPNVFGVIMYRFLYCNSLFLVPLFSVLDYLFYYYMGYFSTILYCNLILNTCILLLYCIVMHYFSIFFVCCAILFLFFHCILWFNELHFNLLFACLFVNEYFPHWFMWYNG